MEHHAYVLEGSAIDTVFEYLRDQKVKIEGNPDITIIRKEILGVDDARKVSQKATNKPIAGEKQYFVIQTVSITPEAQNALLKVFEEPTGRSVFYVSVAQKGRLLPTFLSRMEAISLETYVGVSVIDVALFLNSSAGKRIEMLEPLLDKKGDEKNLDAILIFLRALEESLARRIREDASEVKEGLEAVYRARRFATDKGVSFKILLEQVALLV